MPTKINRQEIVQEKLTPRRVRIIALFGGWLKLHPWQSTGPGQPFWRKASTIGDIKPMSGSELQAQLDAEEKMRKDREVVRLKAEAEHNERRANKPNLVIHNRHHK